MRVPAETSSAVDVVSAGPAQRPKAWLLTVKRLEPKGSEMSCHTTLPALATVVGAARSRARAALGSLQLVWVPCGADFARAPSDRTWPSTANGTDEDRS
jgi:hypothetical protein